MKFPFKTILSKVQGLPFKDTATGFLAVYFLFLLTKISFCGQGITACGMNYFGFISPFYLLLMPIVTRITAASYIVLFLVSSTAYLFIFYHSFAWIEERYTRFKERPKFILKKM